MAQAKRTSISRTRVTKPTARGREQARAELLALLDESERAERAGDRGVSLETVMRDLKRRRSRR